MSQRSVNFQTTGSWVGLVHELVDKDVALEDLEDR